MKKLFALTLIFPTLLVGCTKTPHAPQDSSYVCRHIAMALNNAPHRYRGPSGNKQLPTIQAKLEKEYRHYDCQQQLTDLKISK